MSATIEVGSSIKGIQDSTQINTKHVDELGQHVDELRQGVIKTKESASISGVTLTGILDLAQIFLIDILIIYHIS